MNLPMQMQTQKMQGNQEWSLNVVRSYTERWARNANARAEETV